MADLPNVSFQLSNDQLGNQPGPTDGISALVVSLPDTYPLMGPIDPGAPLQIGLTGFSLRDFENEGVTAAQDELSGVLLWEHIKDFYRESPGQELHLLFVPQGTTPTQIFDSAQPISTQLSNYMRSQNGRIKLLGVAFNVEVAGNITFADITASVSHAQAWADFEFSEFRPISIFLEGVNAPATPAADDLRLLQAHSVSICANRDRQRRLELAGTNNGAVVNAYAEVGRVLGRYSSIPVMRSAGRATDGARVGITESEFPDGKAFADMSSGLLGQLHAKGYLFYRNYMGRSGFYFNGDGNCAAITDDYNQVYRTRTIYKACRIVRETYLQFLLDEVEIDPATGRLSPIVIKSFESTLLSALRAQMQNENEIVAAAVTIDPNQNVNATRKIECLVQVTPYGIAEQIVSRVEYLNPFNQE